MPQPVEESGTQWCFVFGFFIKRASALAKTVPEIAQWVNSSDRLLV
jgi:hypothetical protein